MGEWESGLGWAREEIVASREQLIKEISDTVKSKIMDDSFERAVLAAYSVKLKDDKFITAVIEEEATRRATETVVNQVTRIMKEAYT